MNFSNCVDCARPREGNASAAAEAATNVRRLMSVPLPAHEAFACSPWTSVAANRHRYKRKTPKQAQAFAFRVTPNPEQRTPLRLPCLSGVGAPLELCLAVPGSRSSPHGASVGKSARGCYWAAQPHCLFQRVKRPKMTVSFRPTPVKSRPSSCVAWCEIHRLATAVTRDGVGPGAGSPTRLYTARCCRIARRLSSCARIMPQPLRGERELGL